MLEEYYTGLKQMVDYTHLRQEKPGYMDFHIHDIYEIYYFISGDVHYFIENKVYKLKYGDLLVMNSSELHRATFQSDAVYERITVHIDPDMLNVFSSPSFDLMECFTGRARGERNKITPTAGKRNELEELFKRLEKAGNSEAAGSEVLRLACTLELLVFINRLYKNNAAVVEEHSLPERLEKLFTHIDKNLDGDLSLSVLSAVTYTDRFYLSRLFKNSTGMNIQDYILYKRVYRAKELLSRGMSVMEACQGSGFNDYSNFIRTFKKLTGTSPGRFGRRFRE